MASLLSNMPEVQSSSSFQDELRESLLESSRGAGRNMAKKNKANDLFAGVLKFSQKHLSYFTLTAAAFVMVVALALLYNGGPVRPDPGKGGTPWDPYTAMIEREKQDNVRLPGEETLPGVEKEPDGEPSEPGQETEPGKTESGESSTAPPAIDKNTFPSHGQPAEDPVTGTEPGVDPLKPPDTHSEIINPDTKFKVGENLQNFKVAGVVNLPPVFYGTASTEAALLVEKVNYSWKPRKTVSMQQSEARTIATQEWAREVLSNEGFPVREGDYLECSLRETPAGVAVEVSYIPQKSSELPLILHYEEGKGGFAYYYQDDGGVLPSGFYTLLSPAKAFERVQEMEWYAPSSRLSFSFQEVSLTYHDFWVGEDTGQKKLRLPAYCFLGRETFNNGGELKLYLPALP